MLIPEEIVGFFAMRPIWCHAGTRGADLAPAVHFAHGFHADPERRFVDAVVIDAKGSRLKANLADNGRLTLNLVQLPSHKSYQLKGRGEVIGPADAAARAWQKALCDENAPAARAIGFPEAFIAMSDGLLQVPSTLIRLHVEDIFDQMPGPGAGKRVEA